MIAATRSALTRRVSGIYSPVEFQQWILAAVAASALAVACAPKAYALPSFARQTGMPCSQCHTVSFGPALTPYGRQFKLNGYVLGFLCETFIRW